MGYRIQACCFYFTDPNFQIKTKYVVFPNGADEEREGNSLALRLFCVWLCVSPRSVIRHPSPNVRKADCLHVLAKPVSSPFHFY